MWKGFNFIRPWIRWTLAHEKFQWCVETVQTLRVGKFRLSFYLFALVASKVPCGNLLQVVTNDKSFLVAYYLFYWILPRSLDRQANKNGFRFIVLIYLRHRTKSTHLRREMRVSLWAFADYGWLHNKSDH